MAGASKDVFFFDRFIYRRLKHLGNENFVARRAARPSDARMDLTLRYARYVVGALAAPILVAHRNKMPEFSTGARAVITPDEGYSMAQWEATKRGIKVFNICNRRHPARRGQGLENSILPALGKMATVERNVPTIPPYGSRDWP